MKKYKVLKIVAIASLIVGFMGGTLSTADYGYTAVKGVSVPKLNGDEFGIKQLQKTKYSNTTFFRWETITTKKNAGIASSYGYNLCIYAEKKGKIKRIKAIKYDNLPNKTKKLFHSEDKDMACLSYSGKQLYLPVCSKKNVPQIYRISLKTGKVEKVINIQKQVGKILKVNGHAKNTIQCMYISSKYMGLRIAMYSKQKKGGVKETYKTCLLNLKNNKVVKEMNCDFNVGAISEKYVVGWSEDSNQLCIQKWNKNITKREIENQPLKSSNTEEDDGTDLPEYKRIFIDKNKIYFSTPAGVFLNEVKSGKISKIWDYEKNKYLDKYNYMAAINKNGKGKIQLLMSVGWRSSYKIINLS